MATARCIYIPIGMLVGSIAVPPVPSGDPGRGVRATRLLVSLQHGRPVAPIRPPAVRQNDSTSSDTITGVVELQALEAGDGAPFAGLLHRATERTVPCGRATGRIAATSPSNTEFLQAHLSGVADVNVRIKTLRAGHRQWTAWIVVTPVDVMVKVTGNCAPGEQREMRRAYSERITIEIPLPGEDLTAGRFAEPADDHGRQWVLTVAPASSDPVR